MTEEAKKIVEALRMCNVSAFRCEDCPVHIPAQACMNDLNAADLIESLYAELDEARRINEELNIMLTAEQSAKEAYRRERDAAIRDLKQNKNSCFGCKHFFENGKMCSLPIEQRQYSFLCWEWRGAEVE